MIQRTLRVLLLAVIGVLLTAAPSWADASAEMNIQDDGVTEDGFTTGPSPAAIVSSWKNQLGADSVRITARWQEINTSPGVYDWSKLDTAVSLVNSAGLQPVLTINQVGPVWASRQPAKNDPTWMMDPARFGDFAGAVAARYGGSVYRYLIGNEPNQGTFQTPQWVGGKPFSPYWYRLLARAAYPRIKAADRGSQVIIGEMAPIGGTRAGSVAPLLFINWLGCRSLNTYLPMRSGPCAGFAPARGDAFGFHPYTIRFKLNPFGHMPDDMAGTGDLPRFFSRLDNVTRRGGILAPGGRFGSVYFTEYGFETKPTDPLFGISPPTQSRWLQQAAYIAWRTPRVKMHNQYLYYDDRDLFIGPVNHTFQTGIVYRSGAGKPSLGSFPHPFYINTTRPYSAARAQIWGQVRPGGATTVTLQQSPNGSAWSNIGTAATNGRGYFSRIRALRRGWWYRFTYAGDQSDPLRVP